MGRSEPVVGLRALQARRRARARRRSHDRPHGLGVRQDRGQHGQDRAAAGGGGASGFASWTTSGGARPRLPTWPGSSSTSRWAGIPGIFHVTNQGATTWYEFARLVLGAAGLDPGRVEPISTAELDATAPGAPSRQLRARQRRLATVGLEPLAQLGAGDHGAGRRADGLSGADSRASPRAWARSSSTTTQAKRWLAAWRASGEAGISDIVVVDNGSTDGSIAVLKATTTASRLVRSPHNGRLRRRGEPRRAAYTVASCCSSATPISSSSRTPIERLAAALEADPGAAVAGPMLVEPDGSVYPSGRSFPDARRRARARFRRTVLARQSLDAPLPAARRRPAPGPRSGLGVGGLLSRATRRLRCGRRLRRGLLHVRRGRRPLLAAAPRRLGRSLRARSPCHTRAGPLDLSQPLQDARGPPPVDPAIRPPLDRGPSATPASARGARARSAARASRPWNASPAGLRARPGGPGHAPDQAWRPRTGTLRRRRARRKDAGASRD